MNILNLLQQDGITTKKVAGTNGGEHAAPCPMCAGTDRFRCWPEQAEGGKWWCRQCGKGGDLIQYLKEVRGMKYPDACRFLGREPEPMKRSPLIWDRNREPAADKWLPKKTAPPVSKWTRAANAFVMDCQKTLWSEKGTSALAWLKDERGLTEQTIRTASLGLNPAAAWRKYQTWGLDPVLKENGKPKKLWLPVGLVIPKITGNPAAVTKIKVRRPEQDELPRYYLLPGSEPSPLTIPTGPSTIVVESELDALLLYQVAGQLVSVVCLGSAQMKPDDEAHQVLARSKTVLLALDSDQAGAKAAWGWWAKTYPQAKRWPPVMGKDPGDMLKAGVDLLAWVKAGLQEEPKEQPAPPAPALQPQQEDINDVVVDSDAEPQEPPATRIKCRDCRHPNKETLTCAKGHKWWGLQLLHCCPDFSNYMTTR